MGALELLLADGRFPGGGFAHSGGLEPAVADGSVRDVRSLGAFIAGRLHSAGSVEGWLASAACRAVGGSGAERAAPALARLDVEAEAHQPSPFLREAARAQGRGLRRSAAVLWPAVAGLRCEVYPVVLGSVAAVAGLDPVAAARLAVYGVAMTIASAAAKLAALDMADALAVVAGLATDVDALAVTAAAAAAPRPRSAPWQELRAEDHRAWEVRLFAS
ncbi:MAG: urease accessory protein UreF [Acidimicrobiales bacterium]|nr:urease accessory protein UreF [Acidimicrobiales bacterium]